VQWFNVQGISGTTGGSVFSGQLQDYIYPITYFVLVMMFTYFYTGIMFNSKEIAENLQKQGGFVAGIRPGKQTEEYLGRIVNRLTLFGSIALGLLAVLPFLLDVVVFAIYGTPLSSQLTIGGTSFLITVSVAIETLRQIESKALMVTYDSID
jgi:preprotein translocase subunit SecY